MKGKIAYFSAEFGIDESLPIYSGGLGVLAGDHVKTANDLGLPLVAVGVLYRKGYFVQRIKQGMQEVLYPQLDLHALPVEPVLGKDGQPILVEVPMARSRVLLRVWLAQVGAVPVYLMDADHEANREEFRHLTDSLYGGDRETRLSQEIILGIGGVRLLTQLGIEPEVWHINEGHVAMLALERIRQYCAKGLSFATALEVVRAGTVFTTHTPVPAGHDTFGFELMDEMLLGFFSEPGSERGKMLELGRVGDQFNMSRLAFRTSAKVNGVSRLHGAVSRELFRQWLPDIPKEDFPVCHITNGIHSKTWLGPEMRRLYNRYLPADWEERVAEPEVWHNIFRIPDGELWEAHQLAKGRMLAKLGLPALQGVLTVGFARRFAAYKRALLIFRDLDRLEQIISGSQNQVCFIFAGKAHPDDQAGKELISRIIEISRGFKHNIFFVENYDLRVAKQLVQGVDLWLNTPLKPLEASGTSGQKAAINGVLNISVLDGWWAEGYNGKNGWAIEGIGQQKDQDREDSETLYRLLENEVMPAYYSRVDGIPQSWTGMMKESICSLSPQFSTHRMLREYRDLCYLPAAARVKRFRHNGFEVARRVADYKEFIRANWHKVEVISLEVKPLAGRDSSQILRVQAKVELGPVWHRDVRVEAVGSNGLGGVWKYELTMCEQIQRGVYRYETTFPYTADTWSRANPNVRVVPISPDFSHDFELELTRWGQSKWR